MRESEIEAYFVKRVVETGGIVRKAQWIGRNGCPDRFYAFPNGNHGFVELKASGCTPEPHQQREIARLRSMGVTCYVMDSVDKIDGFIAVYGK